MYVLGSMGVCTCAAYTAIGTAGKAAEQVCEILSVCLLAWCCKNSFILFISIVSLAQELRRQDESSADAYGGFSFFYGWLCACGRTTCMFNWEPNL